MAAKALKISQDELNAYEQALNIVKNQPELLKQNKQIELKLAILSKIILTHLGKFKDNITSVKLHEEITRQSKIKEDPQTFDQDLEKFQNLQPEIALQIYIQIAQSLFHKETDNNTKIGVVHTHRKILGT